MTDSTFKRTSDYKVVTDYNGLKGTLVETITRIPVYRRKWEGSSERVPEVFYKGKRYRAFMLPSTYGDIQGWCIDITSDSKKELFWRECFGERN